MSAGPTLEPSGGDDQLSVEIAELNPTTTLLRVRGEVDMLTSPLLQASVEQSLQATPELLILDLDGVDFLGTSGLAALVQVRAAARLADAELRLVCTNSQVLRPLALAGLTDLFVICDSASQALGAGPAE